MNPEPSEQNDCDEIDHTTNATLNGEQELSTARFNKNTSDMVVLSDEEGVKDVLATSLLGLWEVVNNLTRLRPTHHERYRVTIFGSARVPTDHTDLRRRRNIGHRNHSSSSCRMESQK